MAELAVVRRLGHVEIDVAGRLVGEPSVDERPGDRDDLGDVLGRTRHLVDSVDSQRREAIKVIARHVLGQLVHRGAVFLRLDDQLVVNVGDIDHPRRLVAQVDEISLDGVEDDRPDHVPDVAGRINGRPADVHTDLAGLDGLEGLFGLGQCVIDAKGHEDRKLRHVDIGSINTTAWHTITSWRPTGPRCSPVLALTLTAPSSSRSSLARFARIAGL